MKKERSAGMMELWRTIGKACLERAFCDELQELCGKRTAIDDRPDVPDLKNIHQKLIEGKAHFLSRWELGEVDRIFQNSKLCSILDTLRRLMPQRSDEDEEKLCKVIGLACVDKMKARHFAEKADLGTAALQKALFFGLFCHGEREVEYLTTVFRDAKILQHMEAFSDQAWTRHGKLDDCKWALSFSSEYIHETHGQI